MRRNTAMLYTAIFDTMHSLRKKFDDFFLMVNTCGCLMSYLGVFETKAS